MVSGIMALLAAFQDWDGYAKIVGGKYFLSDRPFEGTPS
jgi:hypothetical protein